MTRLESAHRGQVPGKSEVFASGELTKAATNDLPPDLAAHLPMAEVSAAQNMATVKLASTPAIEHLRQQLCQAQTPSVPTGAKVIRLRHIAGEWSKVFSSKTACSSGCSHCCHLGVLVPKSEAKLLAKAIGRKFTEPTEQRNMERAGQETKYLGTPCTFLVSNKCSIYAYRPMMCRTLVNMDSVDTLCRLVKDVDVPVPYLNTVSLKGYFAYLTQTEQFADIREWFPPSQQI
jgi:Fe-S-cluster containining protein